MSAEKLFVGPGIRLKAKAWTRGLALSGRVTLASEAGAWRRFGAGVERALKSEGLMVHRHLLPPGEAAKSWASVADLMSSMIASGMGRDGALVAMGGGSVTDAAGFAAAIYQRGIPWVSMPTTLLGQLDSGLGGKTGINLAGGKNLAGCFHRPRAVVCDPEVLSSLPARERVSGLGEALKYGLVFDPRLWRLIVRERAALMAGEPSVTGRVVARGAALKRMTVERDPLETKGPRELLNFGHTLGHALESASGLGALRHGEAVIWGMRAALRLSHRCAGLKASFAAEADRVLATFPVPMPRRVDPRRLLELARRPGDTVMNILVLHGPNLNLLGEREPRLYGTMTLPQLNARLAEHARKRGASLRARQSNSEGELIDLLHAHRKWAHGVVFNPGAYTHYSYALRDAVAAIRVPTIEVHLSNIKKREAFRRVSVIAPACAGQRYGKGLDSYLEAIDALLKKK